MINQREYDEQYYIENKEKRKRQVQQWYIENKERKQKYMQQYSQMPEVKEKRQINNSKRRHDLGFFPLNNYFEGSCAHHISRNFVIYIPEELHKSIWHCLWTGKNMDAINKLAIEFI